MGLFLAHRQEAALGLKGVSVECGGGGAGGGGGGGGGLSWLLLQSCGRLFGDFVVQ